MASAIFCRRSAVWLPLTETRERYSPSRHLAFIAAESFSRVSIDTVIFVRLALYSGSCHRLRKLAEILALVSSVNEKLARGWRGAPRARVALLPPRFTATDLAVDTRDDAFRGGGGRPSLRAAAAAFLLSLIHI